MLLLSLLSTIFLLITRVYSLRDRFPRALQSLLRGQWVKFISGASNQDLPHIRNLCYLYTRAGVDCIDLSADEAVVHASLEGIRAAMRDDSSLSRPVVMVSVNDGDDLHFRKAHFNPQLCPLDCPRPCERVCPALAIAKDYTAAVAEGIDANKCYGCGRCIPICPLGLITSTSYSVSPMSITDLLATGEINAVEIHTGAGHESQFSQLWQNIGDALLSPASSICIIAVSFPDMGGSQTTMEFLGTLQHTMASHTSYTKFAESGVHIWQTDGRPMSGDIGKGTVHASIALARSILAQSLGPSASITSTDRRIHFDQTTNRHFVQLAGGTNLYSAFAVSQDPLLSRRPIGFGGYAFGGYARKSILHRFEQSDALINGGFIEDQPELLKETLQFAETLVQSVKHRQSNLAR